MNPDIKNRIYLYIFIASLVAPILLITSGFFPYFGLGFTFFAYTLIAYFAKKDKNIFSKLSFFITLILSLCLMVRSEGFLTFLNFTAIIYFGSLALTEMNNQKSGIISLALSPLNLIIRSIFIRSEYKFDIDKLKKTYKISGNPLNTLAVIVVTLLSWAIILPLLASANPIFGKMLENILGFFKLNNLNLSANLFLWVFRFLIFTILVMIVPRMATYANKNSDSKFKDRMLLNLLIPKITVSIILIVFFITQIKLYTASPQTLTNLGYTFSEYANEVFSQLTVVALVILALLYLEKERKAINKIFTYILSIEAIFLTFMAYKSAFDYIGNFGFTYKRLYGVAIATLIFGMFLIFLYGFYKKLEKSILLKSSLIFGGIILLTINFLNFDYLIYHQNKASTGQGIDYAYLSGLSPDSLSYQDQFKRISEMDPEVLKQNINLYGDTDGLYLLFYRIESLQQKYQNPDVRGFNILEYLQYKKIKDTDTKSIRSLIEIKP